jgi:hypothetical protein
MKSFPGSFNTAIVGKWNKYILSPNWVQNFLFEVKELQVFFPLDLIDPYFYESNGIRFTPQEDRVIINALMEDDIILKNIDNISLKLINELNKTPIKGIGYNFRFEEEKEKIDISNLFIQKDESKIYEYGCKINNNQIIRSMLYEDFTINMTITYNEKQYFIDFNFHISIKNISDFINDANSGKHGILKYRDVALSFLSSVYSLKID